MNLSDIVPVDRIEVALDQPVEAERLRTADLGEALRRNPDDIFGIAASTWHRIVMSGRFRVDPSQMSEYFDNEDPRLVRGIEAVIKQPMLKEFGYLKATVRRCGKPFVVATSCAAHLYSDELHLYDIALADPRQPLAQRVRKSDTHRGFGLLGDVIRNLFDTARERRCSVVTLTAANRPLVDVFSRHGFEVERSSFAQQALAFGLGIPMEARV